MITELQNFRKKYPEYNDLDDFTLATKLAAKYPEYSDLPEKVKSHPPSAEGVEGLSEKASPSQIPDTSKGFMDKMSESLNKRTIGIKEAFTEPIKSPMGGEKGIVSSLPQRGVRALGEVTGGVGDFLSDVFMSGVKALNRPLSPYEENQLKKLNPYLESLKAGAKDILNTPVGQKGLEALKGGVESYENFKKENPDIMKDLEAVINIGFFLPTTKDIVGGTIKTAENIIEKTPSKVAKLGEKFRIPTTLGEETRNPIIQKVETILENVPIVGLKGFREKQNKAAGDAAKNLLNKYIVSPMEGDIPEANREFAKKMYDNVKGMIAKLPEQNIEPTETKIIAQNLLNRYPDIFKKFQDTKTEGVLKDIIKDTSDAKIPFDLIKGTDIMPKTISFDEAWILRQGLGEKIGQSRKLLASWKINKTEYSQVKQLFNSISNDIENWGKSIGKPEINEAFKSANNAYKDYVVKYDIIQRAYDKAIGEVGAGEMFSPKKFSTELKNIAYKDKAMKIFDKEEIKEISGMANIMQAVKRAGQYMENPPTGNRWGTLLSGGLIETAAYAQGGLSAALETAGVTLGVSGIANFLTTNPIGKRLSYIASNIPPTSNSMKIIIKQIEKQLPRTAIYATGKEISKGSD